MEIAFYDKYGEKYEIKYIEYIQFNGKSTIVKYYTYELNGNEKTSLVSFEGWLNLEMIISEILEEIE